MRTTFVNELIKLFNKKTIYIMIVLVVLLSIFTMLKHCIHY